MDEAVAQIRQDEQQHSRDQFALEEKDKQLEQAGQELALLREQLKTARAEGDDQRRTITNLTTTVSEQQSEIRF
jgi:chromosome segregation ATPase